MNNRPNLLFVMADQLGLNHCGYSGAPNAANAKTPNIDSLASHGVRFINAVSSTPVCAAYRASLLTGKYTTSTGMVINELRMNTNHTCLGHVVSEAGYNTCYIGKWHLYANELGNHYDPKCSFVPPGPDRLGFDGHWAAYNFHHEYYGMYYHTDSPEKLFYGDGVYEPDAQTDMMIEYLGNRTDAESPFCAFLSYGTPHDPWGDDNVPPDFRQMFEESEFPSPPNYLSENDPRADIWGAMSDEDRPLLPQWRRNYYAMTANLDWNIGRLLAALDRDGLAENTIVVFSSDHGEMFGAHGRQAKNIFYEEAARIPLLLRWPGQIPQNSASDACLSTVDILPTLLGLMELPIPAEVEGVDCSTQAREQVSPGGPDAVAVPDAVAGPDAAFMQNTGACALWEDGYEWRALRDKRFTYAVYRSDGHELLFDNIDDPYQMRNLINEADHARTVEYFRRRLTSKMTEINDTFEASTWYRDNWTDDRIILRSATLT